MRFSRLGILLGCTLLVLLAVSLTAGAQGWRIEGNRLLTRGEIEALLQRAGDRPLAERIALLQGEYYRRGYLFAEITVREAGDGSGTVIEIAEGAAARIGRVTLSGTVTLDEERMRTLLGAVPGDRFLPERFERGIGTLLGEYDEAGYPFIQVWIDSLRVDRSRHTVDIALIVADGGQKRISKITFDGLKKTREAVALKLSGLEIGAVYSGARLDEAARRLRSLGVFTRVEEAELTLSADGTSVEPRFRVTEPPRSNTFQVAVGYAQEEGDRPRVFSGLASLEFNNLGGGLKDLHLYWRNDGAERSETRIGYRDRLFLGRSLDVGVTLEQIGLDTLYTWQTAGVEVTLPLATSGGRLWAVSAAVNGDRNVFSLGALKRSWRLRAAAGLSCQWGGEEDRAMAGFSGRATYARKKQYRRDGPGSEAVSQLITAVTVRAGVVMGIARIHNMTTYRAIESGEDVVPLSEQFYLGGAGSLRGYRENQFHGTRTVLSRTELRFGASPRENAYLFIDGGYIHEQREDTGNGPRDLFRAGYGFGLRTVAAVGDVDLSFGVGEKLSLQQTKVHVILGHRF